MLEGLAAWILNTYVGEYVENLNMTQLSIAVLQGAVELDNLPLKKDALKSFDLPVEVKSGFIGKITLQIPLRRLRSEPWVISIKKLYLVAGPLKHTQYNEAGEKKSNQARKLAMLEALEAKWQLHKAEKQEGYGASWFSYGASVATNILENLQLIVEDVHIRYEDDTLIPTCPFAFGIVIKKLSAQSTDKDWTTNFVKGDGTDIKYKLAELDNFSMYLDTNTTLIGDLPRSNLADHEYILAPVSAEARIKRNTSALPLRDAKKPRIDMDVTLETLNFRLSEEQYHSLMSFLKEIDRHDRRMKHRKWRPILTIKESPSTWWKFAINATLEKIEERNKRMTWSFLCQRIKDVKSYYSLYTTYLKTQHLDDTQTSLRSKLEEELSFEEIKVIRETVYQRLKKDGQLYQPQVEVKDEPAPEQQGVLQRWFPGWSGWYGSSSPSPGAENSSDTKKKENRLEDVGEPPPKIAKAELEHEIMEVIHDTAENTSFLKKDTVFANMNFNLKAGSFQLLTRSTQLFRSSPTNIAPLTPILEMECSTIAMLFESRPRTSAMKFELGVGGIYLRDKMTENTIFPNILSPQAKERILLFRSPSNSQNASHPTLSPTNSSSGLNNDTLFELKYEKNPTNTNAHYRVCIKTKPLDIVYNPSMVKRVREFFSSRKMKYSKASNLRLTEAAMRQYEAFKAQTRAELQQTIENLMEGDEPQAKRWDVNFDISAPQIMVPENFTDPTSNMVVLDLGHLHFYNKSNKAKEQKSDDANDEFQTPPSTPPSEEESIAMDTADMSRFDLTEAQFYDKLYEKYALDLNDLQVMVGKPKDNWKQARGRGSTHLHIIDKFSINLLFERRLISTSDPRWPSTMVSGNMPSLTLHLNEQKVFSLTNCIDALTTPTSYTVPYDMSASTSGSSLAESLSADLSNISDSGQPQSPESTPRMDSKIKELLEESRLVLAQFSIHNMSLEIQSRGRPLVELQVTRVKANLTKRPYDTAVSLSVHSLLVADALQTYGQDFELLVASHRHVMLDSKSGSILGSDPASPISVPSPTSPRSPVETLPQAASLSSFQTIQDAISNAFQKVVKSASRATQFYGTSDTSLGRSDVTSPVPDTEALISLELDIIDITSPSNLTGAPLKVANLQFNSLDIIANQETMMELLGFLKIVTPSKTNVSPLEPHYPTWSPSVLPEIQKLQLKKRIEDGHAYKVATATMSSAKVQATIDKDLDVIGSLGGFHILDVSSEDLKHQQLFGVGSDVTSCHGDDSKLSASYFPPPNIMYKTAHEESLFRNEKLQLGKGVYEQILQTTDNLTYDERLHRSRSASVSASPRTSKSKLSAMSKEEVSQTSSLPLKEGSPKSKVKPEKQSLTKIFFEVPMFSVELKGDFDEGERGIVDLKLEKFSVQFEKSKPFCTDIQIYLKSLVMEDLLVNSDSVHRYLLISRDKKKDDESEHSPKLFLSMSCPDSTILSPSPMMPHSLPVSFHDNLGNQPIKGRAKPVPVHPNLRKTAYPQTPPPSARSSRSVSQDTVIEDNLVHIKVKLIDKNSQEYREKFDRTNRFIDVDFSSLEANINLQTWVMLMDFLGMGAKIPDASALQKTEDIILKEEGSVIRLPASEEPSVNSIINLTVKSFVLVFNKPEYELCQAHIENWSSHVNLRDSNFAITGQLGHASLLDTSPYGELYREKFVTAGDQALVFDIFKYGSPDPNLTRDCDIRVKLHMASVRYVHTNRFQSEFVAFLQHFLQLQDVLGRYRAASAGKKVTDKATRGARIKLDVEAKSPILLFPHSWKSTDVLVADFGNLTIKNCFRYDGEEGTLTAIKHMETQEKAQLRRHGSRESVSSMGNTTDTSEFSQDGAFASMQNMTQSVFDQYTPPVRSSTHPMLQSIYGSLDSDIRSPDSLSLDLENEREIYDPTDSPSSPEGSSVDPEFFPESGSWLSISSALPSQSQLQASFKSTRSAGKIRRTPSGNSLRQLVSMDTDDHTCLLDIMDVDLTEMDLYSAERVKKESYQGNLSCDLEFKSCIIQRQGGKLLQDKCRFKLQVERNLEGDISHSAPDWKIQGTLSSVHCSLDIAQYKLVRGILEHNLGEKLPEFQRPLMSHLLDPENQTVLSGKTWQGIAMAIDLNNVTVELLISHPQGPECPEASLAKLDFICSTLKFDSYSDSSKDVDLVSNEIVASDTRYRDAPVNVRPNMFEKILQPGPHRNRSDIFQLELHYRLTRDANRFSVILNNMKLMCIFDWLLTVQEFIMTGPDNPFKQDQEDIAEAVDSGTQQDTESIGSNGSRTTSPVTISSGIMTKRGPIVEEVETPFEMKLNVSDTEFVVVEDSRSLDTNAVILKSTAILNFRPKAQDKILSCTLQSIEVFSCSLLAEEETALSIIDPLTIHIDLNANPLPEPKLSSSTGLLEASKVQERNLQLEVAFNVMNIRLSYHDMNMFLAILNSLPEQALKAANRESQKVKSKYPENKIIPLRDLGFGLKDCEKALETNDMNLEAAAIWLTTHGTPLPKAKRESKKQSKEGGLTLTGMELKSSCISLCLIDDCGDSDVPLAELDFNNIQVNQKLLPVKEGRALFSLTGDFYNRSLSGWEPFLEQWRCHCEWKQVHNKGEKKTSFQVNAPDVLNLNITSAILEQYNKTKQTWSEDYYRQKTPANSQRSVTSSPSSPQRRRVPFVPFMLHNQTGCTLWFATVTTTAIRHGQKPHKDINQEGHIKASEWKKVAANEKMPFMFQRKEKIRHQKTHDLRINQLVVKVDGWQKLNSVTVDKVGVYFRHADADKKQATGLASLTYASSHDPEKQQKARVVFDVQQEGSARKVITVRSALIIRNRLDSDVELKMASGSKLDGKFNIMEIPAGNSFSIPLPYINYLFYVRPSDWPVRYSSEPIQWRHVGLQGQIKDKTFKCETSDSSGGVYRFCASVRRESYPEQVQTDDNVEIIPGHTITLLPPVVIHNLLPIDTRYYIKNSEISGSIRPGKTASLHAADPQSDLELGVNLENFLSCRELLIPPDTIFYKVKLRLFDQKQRLLELVVKIISRMGGSVNLYILAPYWLVNKSGLPLVFSQDSATQEMAGQFEEHELARSVTPLLFSYAERELPEMCSMRVGRSVKGPNSVPIWCSRFSLEQGIGMRRLTVVPREKNRPDWIYNIGIKVEKGNGKYKETNIVTFAPLYELDNKSSHKLAVAQRHIALGEESRIDGHLTVLPQCKLPFHWPRLDLDQLLCVMLLENKVTNWDDSGHNNLLRVEVVKHGPTFFIVFGDAEGMPPPFRIDNLSEVQIQYCQKQGENMRGNKQAWIRPHTQVPYAWDEPTLDHTITLKVQSGSDASYNMDQLGEGPHLCYSNLIYLAATTTFSRNVSEDRQNLVLEVVESNYLKFMPKEKGKRSQLWRMTSQGMLEHEGSMAPRDPHRGASSTRSLVLDIDDIALQPDKIVPLTLRKPDERRRSTQTWIFTQDGKLCSSVGVLCVQVLGGESCLLAQAVAVLGPCPTDSEKRIPPHMQITRQKLMPGSGCLSVRIAMDGPIRVLQITDISQRQIVKQVISKRYDDWAIYDERTKNDEEMDIPELSSLELNMSLKGGFGISLINKVPQELVYITLGNIQVDYVSHPNSVTVDVVVGSVQVDYVSHPNSVTVDVVVGSVQVSVKSVLVSVRSLHVRVRGVQVDNQLFDTQRPVMLFVTPTNKREGTRQHSLPYMWLPKKCQMPSGMQKYTKLVL
ncbi:hypothetical protein FSP39_021054 [Pinctada imbricata]|uniref:UBA domain-containing protein n=1 Tax=Pinctada imbricata TaxID=66713 RepID=A0AA88Y6A2_PINIB|nr:hypothetical protein FSP39_021054 [Pinctada imbricata]